MDSCLGRIKERPGDDVLFRARILGKTIALNENGMA